MAGVSLFRLYALRAAYLIVAAGLAATIWPLVINHPPQWPLMNSVVGSMLAALSVLAAFGIRYPLQMLPILLFELAWKSIWLIAVALPLWSANRLDARTWETVRDCLFAAILIPLIPWRYVIAQYVTRPGDRWRRAGDGAHIAPAHRMTTAEPQPPEPNPTPSPEPMPGPSPIPPDGTPPTHPVPQPPGPIARLG
jgi:hypothetical protein